MAEPPFTGTQDWYESYDARHASDGVEGRLVSMYTFRESWGVWEMHPHGSEVVLCVSGTMTLHQEHSDGAKLIVRLGQGQFTINEPGVWHTADIDGEATAIFITAGSGTQRRPR
jgi:mannose-6-phosphate isomerase-like protein (cupin superfamily)